MCKVYMATQSVTQFASSVFLTVMSVDRYIAACHPISAPNFRTPMIAGAVSFAAWTTSILLMLPTFMYAVTDGMPCGGQNCIIRFEDINITTGLTADLATANQTGISADIEKQQQ